MTQDEYRKQYARSARLVKACRAAPGQEIRNIGECLAGTRWMLGDAENESMEQQMSAMYASLPHDPTAQSEVEG